MSELKIPAGIAETNALITRLDDCLRCGIARLGEQHEQTLAELAAVFAGSPLGDAMQTMNEALLRSEFLVAHFATLATARAALQGAQYDSLRATAASTYDFNIADSAVEATAPLEAAGLLGSAQQWLMELALAGFQSLEEPIVAPFMATLEQLQLLPEYSNLSVLLTGFVNELMGAMPADRQPELPVFRWADLWTAAFVRTQIPAIDNAGATFNGTITPFGVTVKTHTNVVAATVWAVADGHVVQLPFNSYKVDVIAGVEIWELFGDQVVPVLDALAEVKQLKVKNARLCDGRMVLTDPPKLGAESDPFAELAAAKRAPLTDAALRHPVHLADPVELPLDHGLPIAEAHIDEKPDLNAKSLKGATRIIGLLRFDGGEWRVQPLAADTKKGVLIEGGSQAKLLAKLKSKSLAILQERASKLLRA